MKKKIIAVPTGECTPAEAIWLVSDGTPKPYIHNVEGDCMCVSCESKIRHIILPYAA